MRIFNQDMTEELNGVNIDFNKGFLDKSRFEQIYIYVTYSQKEILRREIADLKSKLAATDYQAIKYAEGVITAEEYAEMKAQRQAWRDKINELENLIKE